MTIFEIDPKDFKDISKKFYIYSEMLKKHNNYERNTITILNHLEEFVTKSKLDEF